MKEYPRHVRIAEELQRLLAPLIQEEMDDPRMKWASITTIDVSRDLAHARVYISHLKEEYLTESVALLNTSAPFLRSRVAAALHLRGVPQLRFIADTHLQNADRISRLITEARCRDEQDQDEVKNDGQSNE